MRLGTSEIVMSFFEGRDLLRSNQAETCPNISGVASISACWDASSWRNDLPRGSSTGDQAHVKIAGFFSSFTPPPFPSIVEAPRVKE